jgi:cytochrome c-type biogenesis protein CcmH
MTRVVAAAVLPALLFVSGAIVRGSAKTTDQDLALRLHAFLREIRCLVCQNETLAESRAELAVDLREEIREQMVAGSSDAEIRDFLRARYGDFVLYRPRLKPLTYPLWFGPFLLLGSALIVLCRIITRRATAPSVPAPSNGDLQRARRLLGRSMEDRSI